MRAEDIAEEMARHEERVRDLKAELYDELQVIAHLRQVYEVAAEEEQVDETRGEARRRSK